MPVEYTSYRKEREDEIMNKLSNAMEKVKTLVQSQVIDNISQSAPSHPQIQTGELYRSIYKVSRIERDANTITAVIGTNVPHGFFLEMGTVKMPAYPWLFPAVELKRQEIIDTILAGGGATPDIEVVAGIWNE